MHKGCKGEGGWEKELRLRRNAGSGGEGSREKAGCVHLALEARER